MKLKGYNLYYQEENYFGNPYPGLIDFFKKQPEQLTVLDLGCGQGRDSLSLSRIGHTVIGVDHSEVGISQMNAIAKDEGLSLEGIVGDLYTYNIPDTVDLVLLDSIVHFYKKDIDKESQLILRVIDELREGGILCNFMQKGVKREKHLKNLIKNTGLNFTVLVDDYVNYPEYDGTFHMYVIQKKGSD